MKAEDFVCYQNCGVCPVCVGSIDLCLKRGKVWERMKVIQKQNRKLSSEIQIVKTG
jgi:hypothetical protein